MKNWIIIVITLLLTALYVIIALKGGGEVYEQHSEDLGNPEMDVLIKFPKLRTVVKPSLLQAVFRHKTFGLST